MSGRFVKIVGEHTCDTPGTREYRAGTVWQCECGTYYKLIWFGGLTKEWRVAFWRNIFGPTYKGEARVVTAPSVRRVDALTGHRAPEVFFASLATADETVAELDALREKAVRVDELEAENVELRRQLAETRKALGWERG